MKKITAISVVSLLLLASCGGKGKDAASMDYGLEEANEVISYYNTSIDITKKMVDMGEISKIIDYMQKNGKTLVAPVVIRTPVSATDTTALLNPGDCFPSSAADSLKMYTVVSSMCPSVCMPIMILTATTSRPKIIRTTTMPRVMKSVRKRKSWQNRFPDFALKSMPCLLPMPIKPKRPH